MMPDAIRPRDTPEPRIGAVCVGRSVRAMIVGLTVMTVSCASPRVDVSETSGNSLPAGLEFPALAGGVNEVTDQVCRWARDSQRPFPPPESVVLTRVYGPGNGRYGRNSALAVFLQREHPRELTLMLNPATLVGHGVEAQRVVDLVDREGWWTLEKLNLTECVDRQRRRLTVRWDALTLCVEVRHVEAPPSGTAEAEYRDLFFKLGIGLAQQPLHVQVMTLHQNGRLFGRSINAVFSAGPADFGRVRRTCDPAPIAVGFDSSGELR